MGPLLKPIIVQEKNHGFSPQFVANERSHSGLPLDDAFRTTCDNAIFRTICVQPLGIPHR